MVLMGGKLQQPHYGAGLIGASTPCLPGTLTGMPSDCPISQPSKNGPFRALGSDGSSVCLVRAP